ncbi:MAG: NADH-quinone oxidoreductase subunit NuoE [Acetobacteraceae bacterium]
MSTADNTAQNAELPSDLVQTFRGMVAHEHHARGASIEALRLVQERFGWISDAHLAQTAQVLGMTPADLDGIATYFNLLFRKPVGKNVIMLCDSVSCWLVGQEQTRDRLCKKLQIKMGETTPDGEFTLLPIVCLGHCDHAPAMLIGKELYGPVRPEDIDAIIDDIRSKNHDHA